MPVIEVQGLTYSYPNSTTPSLSNINFNAERGEFILITGPSGCGKTTFCRCLNGLIPNSYGGSFQGKVSVEGLSTTQNPVYELAQRVGLVFQNPENELFCTSVEREVAFGLENLAIPREELRSRIDEALSQVGISPLRDKSPEELSGGEQQKVAVAALLAMKPRILVLDEPTANLDPLSASSVMDVLVKVNKESAVTIILVEHRLEMAAPHADRCIIFDGGKIALDGHPSEVLYSEATEGIGIGVPKVVQVAKRLISEGKLWRKPLSSKELAESVRGCGP